MSSFLFLICLQTAAEELNSANPYTVAEDGQFRKNSIVWRKDLN